MALFGRNMRRASRVSAVKAERSCRLCRHGERALFR
jgi:hypothetical protein